MGRWWMRGGFQRTPLSRSIAGALAFALALSGCSLFAYQNQPLTGAAPVPTRATFQVDNHRGDKAKNVLVLLALSGGGTRAAYFAARSMFALQHAFPDIDILANVDVISSVSGGSLTAAYYCLSQDPSPGQESSATTGLWTLPAVQAVLDHDYIWGARGLVVGGYLLRPYNLPRTYFTAMTRTDVMADVFENGIYEKSWLAITKPTFADLNPGRPYLILNAGNGTEDYDAHKFATLFTFTRDDFDTICSDINSYPLAYGVMASAAFPGVFNYMTLRDFGRLQKSAPGAPQTCRADDGGPHYLHLFDGGTVDNLGLESLSKIIWRKRKAYDYFVVILVDAYTGAGADDTKADVRGFFGHLIDLNFITTYDSLLASNRYELLNEFITGDLQMPQPGVAGPPAPSPKLIFWHLTFDKIARFWPNAPDPAGTKASLAQGLDSIATNFELEDDARARIDAAVDLLVTPNNACLQEIRAILRGAKPPAQDPCRAENKLRYASWLQRLRHRERSP